MGDNQQPENVDEHENQENAEEQLIPHHQQNDVAPEGEIAEPRPQLLNVREVILPPLPPVNGIIQIPNGPGNHQEVLFNLEEHLGRYANLADLIARNNEQAIDMGEIRDLLDAIDLVDEEERAENNGERRHNPGDGAPPEDKHDDSDDSHDSDDSDGEEPGLPAVGHVLYIGRVEKN